MGGSVMICTYENYLKEPYAISFEESLKIHEMMISEINGCDADTIEDYNELVEKCTSYAKMRADWTYHDASWKMDNDSLRTSKHDVVIGKFNQLARWLKKCGKEATWRDLLGYEEDNLYNRKRIGDFACFLAYIHGINGR